VEATFHNYSLEYPQMPLLSRRAVAQGQPPSLISPLFIAFLGFMVSDFSFDGRPSGIATRLAGRSSIGIASVID
jgi:hypothetical protein